MASYTLLTEILTDTAATIINHGDEAAAPVNSIQPVFSLRLSQAWNGTNSGGSLIFSFFYRVDTQNESANEE